jgi:preprotein translocase SecE subunit
VNREFKRRMRREQRAQERSVTRPPVPMPQQRQRRERVRFRQYLREIQAELKRVMWPTPSEVITYSILVIIVVSVLTTVVFLLDLGFAKAIVALFNPAKR